MYLKCIELDGHPIHYPLVAHSTCILAKSTWRVTLNRSRYHLAHAHDNDEALVASYLNDERQAIPYRFSAAMHNMRSSLTGTQCCPTWRVGEQQRMQSQPQCLV